MLEARYEKVRHGGAVRDCAALVAMGVREEDGRRMRLGVSVSLSEAEVHWRSFLESRRLRGLEVTTLITSDDHAGMRAAVASDLRRVFNAADRGAAVEQLAKRVEKYRDTAPKLSEWTEANVPEGLAVFALPEAHRRRLRTVNGLERANGELHRHTRVAMLFPNEESLLRLVWALAAEISEEWETARAYLTPRDEVLVTESRPPDPPAQRKASERKHSNPA